MTTDEIDRRQNMPNGMSPSCLKSKLDILVHLLKYRITLRWKYFSSHQLTKLLLHIDSITNIFTYSSKFPEILQF